MKKQPAGTKPTDTEIRTMADAHIKKLVQDQGPEVSEEAVLAGFQDWVLPDRQLTLIRERLERWRRVAQKRAARREKHA